MGPPVGGRLGCALCLDRGVERHAAHQKLCARCRPALHRQAYHRQRQQRDAAERHAQRADPRRAPRGKLLPALLDIAKAMSKISTEMKDLGTRAKEGKLAPEEFQGGTASLSER